MIRSILSVLVGYTSLAIIVMTGFSVAFVRPVLAFEPGTLKVTSSWLIYTILLSAVAALAGGWICRQIARSFRPVQVLAGLVLALGMVSAIQNSSRPEPTQTAEELAEMEPMDSLQLARQPDWYAFRQPDEKNVSSHR